MEKLHSSHSNASEPKDVVIATATPAINLDEQCAVPLSDGRPCRRPITCKKHGFAKKRAVTGRSAPLDQLWKAYRENADLMRNKAEVPVEAVPESH